MQAGGRDGRTRFKGDFAAALAGARADRPAAWGDLYAWLAPGVAGYLRMLGAREVDDLTCEVLLAVFRRTDSFEGSESNFRSWVFTVAHSRLVDERRRRGRQPNCVPIDADFEPPTSECPTETAAMRSFELADIEAVCAQLPADQRSVVLLRIIGELSIEQVAEALGKSPGAVKQLQRRGFESARRIFSRQGVTL
jgi:RNA polymerase sigma-70 factor (ECF subfamily)